MPFVDPELPWGCWMRVERRANGDVYVDDETGRTWSSLRKALWVGRLGMPDLGGEPPDDLLECVHAALAARVRRQPDGREEARDVLGGDLLQWRFFVLWLSATGLAPVREDGSAVAELTADGWAVLHLLAATRPHHVRRSRPSAASVRALVELGLEPEDRSERLARVEREAAGWDAAFLRRSGVGRPAVILAKRGDGPVPAMLTVWEMSFGSDGERDAFHEWLCHRLDRWPAWAELASEYGSAKLTHHLLTTMAAALND